VPQREAAGKAATVTPPPQFGFLVEYVQDIEAATRFYTDVVGLTVQRTHPTFVQFEHFAIGNDAGLSGTGEPEIFWLVDDAAAAFGALPRDVEVTLALEEQPCGKVFGIAGPSGRPVYLLELAADRPSQAVE
jgi:catechol 2,3-dioxygenase-like lactoylglutathione lyase family enzyme